MRNTNTPQTITLTLLTLAAAVGLPASTYARSGDARDAERMCKHEMRREHDADGFHGVTVDDRGHHTYRVWGQAERDGRRSQEFKCRVERHDIVRLQFDGWQRHHGSDSHKGEAVAAGVLVGAVIAAAASSSNSHEHQRDYRHNDDYRRHEDRSKSWHPARDITCYRNLRQCYETGSGYSARWTRREFH